MCSFITGILKRFLKASWYFIIFFAAFVLLPNIPPNTIFSRIDLDPLLPRTGPLAPNTHLNNAQKLYVDKISSPEAFELVGDDIYTGVDTGEIVKITKNGQVTFVTKIGQPCSGVVQEDKCGRPLGIKVDPKKNMLYVADAYYGIWKVDLKTDKKQQLVSPTEQIDGHIPRIFNSLDLHPNGDIYWTSSSSNLDLKDGVIDMFLNPSGRLLHYDAVKGENTVLLNKLYFANGVVISPDDTFVLVAETFHSRVLKYYIAGPKKGTVETFITGLPGPVDNIRALPDGSGVQMALYHAYNDDLPAITRSFAPAWVAKKFMARILTVLNKSFEYLHSIYPHFLLEKAAHFIGHFSSFKAFGPKTSGIVVTDWNGKVLASYYNTDGTLGPISDAIVYNDKLYCGSPNDQNFIAAVTAPPLLKKAYQKLSTVPDPKTTSKKEPENVKPVTQKPIEKPIIKEPIVATTKKEPKNVKPATQKPIQKPITKEPTVATTKKEPENVKPATQKPIEKPITKEPIVATIKKEPENVKPPTQKPIEKPITKEPVVTTTPKPTPKPKKTQEKVQESTESKQTTTSKPVDKATKNKQPATKTAEKKVDSTTEPVQKAQKPSKKSVPEEIPIVENIPSDTAKPSKETLKVIKKGGPVEIPNPSS